MDEMRAGKVRLTVEGDPGTTFSGTCAVGDEKEDVSGEVPQSFTYELDGRKLHCEIRNEGPGSLEVALSSGNDRSIHRTNAPGATISLTYSGSGVSSSASSATSGSVIQQTSSSGGSSSSSVNQQSSRSSQRSRWDRSRWFFE